MHDPGTALITGASSGIGATFARRLAGRGHDLILVARRRDKLESLARQLEDQYHITVEILIADFTRREDIENVADHIKNCRSLRVLINNAGFGISGHFLENDVGKHLDMLSVHVTAIVILTHAALPGLMARGGGDIINVSSVSAFLTGPGCVSYCATKAYVNSFTKSLHTEYKDKNIRLQALCPGFTYTEFHDRPEIKNFNRTDIPGWLWLTSEKVVDLSLKALARGKVIYITGWRYRIITELLCNRIIGPILIKLFKRI
nr:SDR family oxidoreductase [candidate division Zixibacteria bacterium]